MTLVQIEKRVLALERTVKHLATAESRTNPAWYRTQAGGFAGDPIFDEIVKLGRAYRRSQRPVPQRPRS